jgi:hypothetical protein
VDNISHLHALLILYVDESNCENVNSETREIETCTWVCLKFSILYKVVTVWRWENIKTKLRVFERKVLRRIYGPTKEKDGTWWIKSNEELNRLTGNKNIINYIKAQRLVWFGHVHRMPDNSMVKKYMSGHPH